jgi:hypothetical protein
MAAQNVVAGPSVTSNNVRMNDPLPRRRRSRAVARPFRPSSNSGVNDGGRGGIVEAMAQPSTPLPTQKASGDDERVVLFGYLDYHRAVLARKAEGISDEQARLAACPPSDLSLLGLVRHMTEVERQWFRRSMRAEDAPPIYYGAAHPDGDEDGDLHPPPGATIDEALAGYWAEIDMANRNIAAASLDDLSPGEPDPGHSLRRTIVHMIEEYARHCGHADLLRQAIDGATGD